MGSSNKADISKLSNWDLVNSFITATWWRNLVNDPRDRAAYEVCVGRADDFRNELMRRLELASDSKIVIQSIPTRQTNFESTKGVINYERNRTLHI